MITAREVESERTSPERHQLLDGGPLKHWQSIEGGPPRWRIVDGVLEVVPRTGDLVTIESFNDIQVHIEFLVPELPTQIVGQDRGNSGLYVLGRYELQILDSYGLPPTADGCGAIYGLHPPLRNACRRAGQWQAYDVAFRAPCRDTRGLIAQPARITVFHNGVLIHNNVSLTHPTLDPLDPYEALPGPMRLQEHGSRVRFRNIFVIGAETSCPC